MPIQRQQQEFHLPNGCQVILAGTDLLSAPVEVIVSPSNGGLAPGGGLAWQVIQEAGPETESACERHFQQHGKIPTAGVAVTTAGRLGYKAIIHAVGPRVVEDDAENRLTETFLNCLRTAESLGCRTLGLPAISTGIFGIPRPVCVRCFCQAVRAYWQADKPSMLQALWLCVPFDVYASFEKPFVEAMADLSGTGPALEKADAQSESYGEFTLELDESESLGFPSEWLAGKDDDGRG